jgi:DNA-binding MurR/RpiR family transcriptional regulator
VTKDLRIKKEIARLRKIFANLPKDKIDTAASLIRNAAFMTITLDDLQSAMNENGVISEYQNGENQWGTKKSPEVEIYNTMIKNHMAIIKQLCDMLPDDKAKDAADELMEFVKKARK